MYQRSGVQIAVVVAGGLVLGLAPLTGARGDDPSGIEVHG